MGQKSLPASTFLRQEFSVGAGGGADLEDRLLRYGRARQRALETAQYLRFLPDLSAQKLSADILGCGSYLIFRDYYTVNEVKLVSKKSCDRSLLCPLCAIFRGARCVRRYHERWCAVQASDPALRLYLVTLTIADGADLVARWRHLRNSLRAYHNQRRMALAGRRGFVQACRAEGAIYSYECKRGSGSGRWHPHVHALWACYAPPSPTLLSEEWRAVTGDSYIVDVRPVLDVSGFIEVFKYALKFSDLENNDLWSAYQVLHGQRLIGSFGCFRGVEIGDSNADDDAFLDLPFIELFFRYSCGGYRLTHRSNCTICPNPGD